MSLATDTVFIVMQFLPARDAVRSLIVCKDWYQTLNNCPHFWRIIYNQYVISQLGDRFEELLKENSISTFLKANPSLLMSRIIDPKSNSSIKEKKRMVGILMGIKVSRAHQNRRPNLAVTKSLIQHLAKSYKHMLNDETEDRKEQEEESFRYKYLLEKQLVAENAITLNSFFACLSKLDKYKARTIACIYIEIVKREEDFKFYNFTNRIPTDEELIQQMIHKVLKYTELDSKYWVMLVEKCLPHVEIYRERNELSTFLKKLFNHKHKEKLSESVAFHDFYMSILRYCSDLSRVNCFLDNLPFHIEKLLNQPQISKLSNIIEILEYSKEKHDFLLPQSTVENFIEFECFYEKFDFKNIQIIKFLILNYQTDIYQIDKKVHFFTRTINSLIGRNLQTIETVFEILTLNGKIDLEKLSSSDDDPIEIVRLIDEHNFSEMPKLFSKWFVQQILNVPALDDIFNQIRIRTIRRFLYEETWITKDEKLSDYVAQLIKENPKIEEETDWWECYSLSDPKFAIYLYL